MYNKIIVVGNLTKDPELKYTSQGTPVCTLRLASSCKYKSREGLKEETLYIDCIVWGKQGDTAAQYLTKGRPVLIDGRLRERRWEDNGQKRSKFEIIAETVKFMGTGKQTGSGQSTEAEYDSPPDEFTEEGPF